MIIGAIYDVRFVAPADVQKDDVVVFEPEEVEEYAARLAVRPDERRDAVRTVLVRRRVQ